MQGILYIVAAASGTGKTSLVNALLEKCQNIVLSVSYTTRHKRANEQEGVNYHYIDKPTFEKMIQDDVFLEYAQVFGNYYGTGEAWVKQQLKLGHDVILEIDWQGAEQVRRLMPEAVGIFILPPSLLSLRERLEKRDQDAQHTIEKRLAEARNEISHCAEFDYWIVNDDFNKAVMDLHAIVRGKCLAISRQNEKLANLLTELMS